MCFQVPFGAGNFKMFLYIMRYGGCAIDSQYLGLIRLNLKKTDFLKVFLSALSILALNLIFGEMSCVRGDGVPSAVAVGDGQTLALFHFDGNINDASGKGAQLSLGPTASLLSEGRFNGGLQITPRGSPAQAVTMLKLGSQGSAVAFSCSLWVKFHGGGEGGQTILVRDNYLLASSDFFLRYVVERHQFEAGIQTKAGWIETHSAGLPPEPGRWYYLSVSYDGSELRLSVDGAEQPTVEASGSPIPTGFKVGAAFYGEETSGDLDGLIDDLFVSSVPASSSSPQPQPEENSSAHISDSRPRSEHPLVVIPQTSEAPPINGDPSGPIWDKASWVGNPVYLNAQEITPKIDMRVGLLWDDEDFYVGFKIHGFRPPIAVTASQGDDGLDRDDAAEVCFIVPGFQYANGRPVQFKLNCKGLRDDGVNFDYSWNGKWDGAVKTEGNNWSATFKLPFANFGIKPSIGTRWLGNLGTYLVGYNYRAFLWSPVGVGHHHDGDFGTFEFGGAETVESSIDKIEEEMSTVKVSGTLGSRGSARLLILAPGGTKKEVKLGGFVNTDFDTETGNIVAQLALPINGPGHWEGSVSVPSPGAYLAKVILTDSTGKIVNVDVKPIIIQRSVVTKVLRYPILGSADAVVSIYNMGKLGVLPAKIDMLLLDSKGAIVCSLSRPLTKLGIPVMVSLGKLTNKESYKLQVKASSADGQSTVVDSAAFTLPARPIWADTKAGDLNGKVLKPWTPIQAQGTALSCWGRTYDLKNNLMPASIVSSGNRILSGPIQFVAGSGGESLPINQVDHPAAVNVSKTGDMAAYTAEASNELCQVKLAGSLEFDGFMTYNVTVIPKKPVDSFSLEIPLDNALAKFMQPLPGAANQDMAGTIPEGGTALGALDASGAQGTVNTVWICNDHAGLFFVSDSLENWKPPEGKAAEVIRRGSDTLLKINFYKSKDGFSQQRDYRFHLQATPIRPFNPGWFKDDLYGGGMEWNDNTTALEPDTVLSLSLDAAKNASAGTFEMIVKNQSDLKAITDIDYSLDGGGPGFDENIASLVGPQGQINLLYSKSSNGMILKTPWGVLGLPRNAEWGPDETHKLAFTWGDKLGFYVDGKLQGELAQKGLPGGIANLNLGSVSGRYLLDGLRLKSTPSGQQELAGTGAMEKTPDTVLFYDKLLDLHSRAKTALSLAKERGFRYVVLWEGWSEDQNGGSSRYEPILKTVTADCHQLGLKFILYFGFELSMRPDKADILDEARALINQSPNYYAPHGQNTVFVSYGGPYQEYLLYHMERLKKDVGVDGIYCDGTFTLAPADNPAFGCGYVDEKGDRIPTIPVDRIRDFVKRMNNIWTQDGGYIVAHLGISPPTMGFANQVWQGEHLRWLDKSWENPWKIIPLDVAQSNYNGVNTGVAKTVIELNMWPTLRAGSPPKWYEHVTSLTDLFRLKLPVLREWPVTPPSENESRKYQKFIAFGVDDCEWIPFWDIAPGDVVISPDLKMSVYRRRDGAMLCVVSNINDRLVDGRVQFKSDGPLAVKNQMGCHDLMTGEAIPFDQNSVSLSLPPFEHRLIVIDRGSIAADRPDSLAPQ